ncbi:helix-turn-helix domain-containing protein [Paenarthrobacter sp. Z7-10]|uniref:helix-turn-helix transcriptional regulator n=1 Tax=Paenarthrobacter sp. Z7-10 TaxID=2787635 RepID=UPI0022A9EEE1|nr:DNA-binding protein [Paenarthrobacter sp. Z7-10]MCZ2404786.1 helix-turn-helix domain-containing protein [Paenarthrobacter sp. Z7-10]
MNNNVNMGLPRAAQDKPEQLMTRAEVARWINLSPKTLANMSSAGLGPDYIKFPCGSLRYDRKDVEKWVALSRRSAA